MSGLKYLPREEAFRQLAIRVFATADWIAVKFTALSAERGEADALAAFNREAADYGIQAVV